MRWSGWGLIFLAALVASWLPDRAHAWIWKRLKGAARAGGAMVSGWVQRRRYRRIHRRAWEEATRDACANLAARFGMDADSAKRVHEWGEHVVDCNLCRDVTIGHGSIELMCPPGRAIFAGAMEAGRRAVHGNQDGLEAAAARAGLLEDRTVD